MPVIDRNDPEQMKAYKSFLDSVFDASFLQDPRWAKVHNNLKAEYVTVQDNGGNILAAATVYIRPILLGHCLLYVNRGPICRAPSVEIVQRLIKEMKPLCKQYKAFAVRFDPNWPYSEEMTEAFQKAGFHVRGRGFTKRDLVMSRKTMRFHLNGRTMEELMASFKTRTRRDINKSLRSDLVLEEGFTPEHLDVFMKLLDITAERDKISHKPRSFFEAIAENFTHDEVRLYLVRKDDAWLSGAVAVNYSGRLFYYHSGSSNELRSLCPNAFLQYQLISWAVESNCKIYDMGGIIRTDPEDGLYLFKSGYCTEELEEYLGELDYPVKKLQYRSFIQAYSLMQKLRSR